MVVAAYKLLNSKHILSTSNNTPLYASLLFLLFGLMLSGVVWHLPIGDYVNYYYGSLLLKKGAFTQAVYEPYLFNLTIKEYYTGPFFANYSPVPPVTSLLLIPFTYLPVGISKLVFNIFSVLIFSLCFYKLVRQLQLNNRWLLILPLVMLPVLKSNVAQGQLYLIVTALLIEGWRQHKNGHKKTAAFLWASAISLKIFPAIILLYLILKKDYRTTAYIVVAVMAISILPVAFMPVNLVLNYCTEILPRLIAGEINDPYATAYQSFAVLARKVCMFNTLLNPKASIFNPALKSLFNWLFTALFLALAIEVNKKEKDDLIKFGFVLFAGVLISGYGTFYGLLFLVPLLVALINDASKPTNLSVIVLIAALVLPVYYFFNLPLFAQFPRLYLFITAALLISYKYKLHYYAGAAIVIIFTSLFVVSKSNFTSHLHNNYYLTKQSDLLLYDYTYTPGKLHLKYITDNGIKEEAIDINDSIYYDSDLKLLNNNIFCADKQVTNSTCRKMKPMRLTTDKIIYLSDEGRGVGFYTLRLANASKY